VAAFIRTWEIKDAKRWEHYQREMANQPPEEEEKPPVGEEALFNTLQATANHTDARVELMDAKADSNEVRRRQEGRVQKLALFGLYPALALVLFGQCYHAPSAAPPAPNQCFTVNLWQGTAEMAGRTVPGSVPVALGFKAFLGAILSAEMGKNEPAEQFVPDKPLPGQKTPPCNPRLGEAEIKGSCWGDMSGAVKPPCVPLYREGQKCYRPIAADPQKGVGMVREAPGQVQH